MDNHYESDVHTDIDDDTENSNQSNAHAGNRNVDCTSNENDSYDDHFDEAQEENVVEEHQFFIELQ